VALFCINNDPLITNFGYIKFSYINLLTVYYGRLVTMPKVPSLLPEQFITLIFLKVDN